ncbi:aspartate aminotransferase family protein [Brucella pseudogrignonensis]|uniref:4-aminobutyrate aminotransferase-like enzyme n=1 Tax=Brucella pseudogrignonensis TaxID=419475 RepID=A0ABU1MCU5_9HYPH|nr:aspartate aminotransferase family protein [Brucella pseudogrignonensis]MDR6433867.1 4-aminobutyrate aminotransferase-like enzyme [Brucella pseudogrignonensis]
MSVPVMINAFDAQNSGNLDERTRNLVERRQRVLGQPYRMFYEEPVHFERAFGVRLYDEARNAYLDAYNNVPCVGHCHPRVVSAIAEQAARLNVHTRYLDEGIISYAEKLLSHFPAQTNRLMLTCTGSEANDLALRIARNHTGGTGFIVTANAYHGISHAIAAMSPSLGPNVPLAIDVRTIAAPDARVAGSPEQIAAFFENEVRVAIADMQRHGIRPAGLLVDTIFSSDGVFAEPPGFLKGAVDAIREAGGLFIADEVQAGFGRLGSHMWGFQRHGIVPDLVTMGKPMGNGYPIAGVVAREEVLERFAREARYFNTFGGNPVACAAASAVLDILHDDDLLANALKVGTHMKAGFEDLSKRHAAIGDVRGVGLFLGVDILDENGRPSPDDAGKLVNELRRRRVLISASGPLGHVLKIRPPLPFSISDADELLQICDEALSSF